MISNRLRLGAAALGAALVLTACSSGGGSGASVSKEGKPYADALAESVMAEPEGTGLGLDQNQADCVAGHFVDVYGVDRMKDAGIEPADLKAPESGPLDQIQLDDGEANRLYESFGKCGVDLRMAMLEEMVAGADDAQPDALECLDEGYSEETFRAEMVASFKNEEPDSQDDDQFLEVLMRCVYGESGDMFDFDDDFSGDTSSADEDSAEPNAGEN